MIKFAYLGSGSRGNAAVIETGGTRVMLDCGFTVKETVRRLARLGIEPEDIDAVLVTHEHSDHIAGVGPFARRYALPVWLTDGTLRSRRTGKLPRINRVSFHEPIRIGDLAIVPVVVPHDAREPCQYVFEHAGRRLGILTDVGHITRHIEERFAHCDALVVECNHDSRMLASGPYPPALKARVGGNYGHLNNAQAAELLAKSEQSRLQHVMAVHISEKNNTCALATTALAGALSVTGVDIEVACQDGGTDWCLLE